MSLARETVEGLFTGAAAASTSEAEALNEAVVEAVDEAVADVIEAAVVEAEVLEAEVVEVVGSPASAWGEPAGAGHCRSSAWC